MLVLAVLTACLTVAAIVLIAASAQLADIPGIHKRIWDNFRLLHLVVVVIACGLLPLGVASCASSTGKNNVINGYVQFINGAYVSTYLQHYTCEKNGDCTRTYACDPHKVVDQYAYTDSDGNYHSEQSHTEWDDCPYATDEYSYLARDSTFVENIHVIAGHIFSSNPKVWQPWRGKSIPSSVARGVPAKWLRLRRHILARKADPVTKTNQYPNYILASGDKLLSRYSADIDSFLTKKLLPEHTVGILHGNPVYGDWQASKAMFVGLKPAKADAWQNALMRLNAVLGMNRQGDLHFVAVNDKLVPSGESERYANALIAYWQGPVFRKKALAKNGIAVIVGVDAGQITWARAKTGMPVGNGEMLNAIANDLPGKPLEPSAVIGNLQVTGSYTDKEGKDRLSYKQSGGSLERIVLREYPFARACMDCKDKVEKDKASFVYLKSSVKTPAWAYWLAGFLALLCGAAGGFGVLLTSRGFQQYLDSPRRY